MSESLFFGAGKGQGSRQSHPPPISGECFAVQTEALNLHHYPVQFSRHQMEKPSFRLDLPRLMAPKDVERIELRAFWSITRSGTPAIIEGSNRILLHP